MSRYFVSISLPADLQKSMDQILPESRYWRKTDPRQLHLTLRYIGDADAGVLKELEDKLAKFDIPEFTLRLRDIGFFPKRGTVRVIWLGAEISSTLIELHDFVDKAVSEVTNSESEHSFTPHVTLARVKGRVKKEKLLTVIPEIDDSFECRIQSFQLMESRQGKGGVEHLPVRTYQLNPKRK
ncbi:RNA 2',3'-cyclic phosphodiesterase [Rhodohalobacter sp.]|uniref:RNA 2',3'-cyclic phosphodiesterase n=1 Tax=Rhodohalobacter sp. TaxID=1974210 RepID=UPI002ACEC14F|nr:RNA 2',3'-cyclic phosphodiesterase [Rhodohalobacter sp.]MDZ7758493.1 RNA 2',3'-cyclic phosphodiesterase [Rhodohalobacter sp.]